MRMQRTLPRCSSCIICIVERLRDERCVRVHGAAVFSSDYSAKMYTLFYMPQRSCARTLMCVLKFPSARMRSRFTAN